MRNVMIGFGVFWAFVVLAALAVPQGEIITLNVVDDEGHSQPMQLWMVQIEGSRYLRASEPDAEWLEKLRVEPAVTLGAGLHAGEIPVPVLAQVIDDDPALRRRVTAAMSRKYGVAERMWAALRDGDQSVPVRLSPRAQEPSS